MTRFDPQITLYLLLNEYSARAHAIRRDLASRHAMAAGDQAQLQQNDDVLLALLLEAEDALRQIGLAKLRLAEGRYGLCLGCGAAISPERLEALPIAEYCLACAERY